MITEIITLKLPRGLTRAEIMAKFERTAPSWRKNPQLIRKHYLFDEQRGIVGGVYLWTDKAHALKWHGSAFREQAKRDYGAAPQIQIFETPIVVDNVTGEITTT